MTASIRSPAAPPLDDDNLLSEILLRLPPQPPSLPRASAVCKRWLSLVSDPGFFRRFRLHHSRSPPLLGFINPDPEGRRLSFVPALDAPNRVPVGRFSLHFRRREIFRSVSCRHGLVLILLHKRLQFLVWDPVTGEQHRIAIPSGFDMEETPISAVTLEGKIRYLWVAGFVEYNNMVLLSTPNDSFIVQLDSLEVKKLSRDETRGICHFRPFESVYPAENIGRLDVADLPQNT